MIVVTNTIRVEKGQGEHIVKQFRSHNEEKESVEHIAEVKGFLGFELWTTNKQEHDEVVVVSKWANIHDQQAWVKSDLFRKIHRRKKDSHAQKRDRKGIIDNEITQYEIAHVQAASLS